MEGVGVDGKRGSPLTVLNVDIMNVLSYNSTPLSVHRLHFALCKYLMNSEFLKISGLFISDSKLFMY
jgi:hypothetical protein